MKNYLYTIFFLFIALTTNAQRFKGGRLGTQIGVAIPTGTFADVDDPYNRSNGYASTGLDVTVFGHLFLTKHLSLGLRGGYSLFEIQDTKLIEQIRESENDLITIRTTPYQNLSLSGVFGYSGYIIKEKLDINPYLGVGIGVIRTSDREINVSDTTGVVLLDYTKNSEIDLSLQLTPGLAFHVSLLSFLDLRFYGEYVFSDHKLTETSTTRTPRDNTTMLVETKAVDYELRAINIGGGLSLRF